MSIRVVANELKPASGDLDFQLHCAALEWSLAEPIIINSADDIKSRVDWKDRVEPYYHQVQNLMRFCRRLPVTLLADDVGLGKTISAGLIVSELMNRARVSKVFVICPKILIPQWIEELGSKFGIEAYGATGVEINGARNRKEPVIVTTYQSATGFLEKQQAGMFDMLILDEAHKVRNLHGTQEPPRMARAIFNALEARLFKYVLMLTATPIQNRLWDIYSLIDCLAVARGHKNPFGTPEQFTKRFIADGKNVARRLQQAHTEEFRKIVSAYMFRTRRVDARLAFPERKVETYPVNPTPHELHLQQLVGENITNFNALQQTSLLVALMSSPHALAAQLENMATKNTADIDLVDEVKRTVRSISIPAKANTVLKIADNLKKQNENWRMVVFTTRIETQKMLGEVLSRSSISYGFISGGDPNRNRATIDAFRADTPRINVIISTDAGAEGVNLQAANVLINYDLPWNPMIVEQRIGRIQRIGSRFRNVYVANVVHHNSPEQRIVARLMEKLQVISHTVGDIEAVLDASNDPNGDSLEKQIRQMVVASLKGQDQEAAARKAEMSIEQAKQLIEQNKAEMDQTLGSGKESDEADIPMPRLKPGVPSIPMTDFVINGLRAEGATVTELGDGLFSANSESLGEEKFTFDERTLQRFTQSGVFMGRIPVLYQPGKPAFERLVQRWIDRSAAKIQDTRKSMNEVDQIATGWVSTIEGARFLNSRVEESHEEFKGEIVCRTRVSNSIDSYEKLIRVTCPSNGSTVSNQTDLSHGIRIKTILPSMEDYISRDVSQDSDIRKFKEYYELRLRTELERSDSGERRTKLESDLSPSVMADAAAVEGVIASSVKIVIRYTLGGKTPYESKVSIAGNGISDEPERSTCELTQKLVPIDCLERCSVTSKQVLRELLGKSEESGEYAIPDSLVTCELTGKKVHQGEIGQCCITGKNVCKSQLVRSKASGRVALASKAINCEITGSKILIDEVSTSSLSEKRFRSDEAVKLLQSSDVAHKSEATQCHYSRQWYPKGGCLISDVTGFAVGKDRAAVSDRTKRRCDISELKVCDVTNQRLLPDEVGICSLTGKQVDVSLLRKCAESGRLAQKTLLEKCEVSNDYVIPELLEQCCLTGKKVRRSLLGTSDISGKRCLASKLVRCEVSKKLLLPEESGICSATGKCVDKQLLKTCAASGKAALASEMIESKASGNLLLPQFTKKLPNGAIVGIDEVAVCMWSRKYLRVPQTGVCSLSGLTFSKSLLNASGEFALLRECLDGKQKGTMFPEPGFLARVFPKAFSSITMFNWISSENGMAHIMFGKKSTFGLNTKIFAVMADGDLNGLHLRGNVLWGRKVKGIWQPIETELIKG